MKRMIIFLIRIYQKFISPAKIRPACMFYPTCSQYAIEALQKRGLFFGSLLAAWRIIRCNPFNSHGGLDPVPMPKRKNQ